MSESNNPYAAPASSVEGAQAGTLGGSIEATLAGHGQLELGATMSEAWARVKGSKRILLGGFLLVYVLMLALLIPAQLLFIHLSSDNPAGAFGMQMALQLVVTTALYPFIAGVMIVCTRHMCGLPIAFGMLFSQYSKSVNLLLTSVLQTILVAIGFLLLIVPGIYLSIAYALALPLVADRNMGPWEALETSRKLVTKHWWMVFGILIIASMLMSFSALFFLIPLIWTVPWFMLCLGVIYRNLAGLQSR